MRTEGTGDIRLEYYNDTDCKVCNLIRASNGKYIAFNMKKEMAEELVRCYDLEHPPNDHNT